MLSQLRVLALVAVAAIVSPHSQIQAAVVQPSATGTPPAVLTIEGLGKGVAPLDGPWQFHLGDDPMWATPGIDDATGHNGWEQLTADAPWGTQGHPGYTGYGWYRRQLSVSPAPGASPDVTLLIPAIDDVYELFWNGVPVGQLGSFPPRVDLQFGIPAQIYGLGPVRSGVLAVRVFKLPSMFSCAKAITFPSIPMDCWKRATSPTNCTALSAWRSFSGPGQAHPKPPTKR